MPKNFVIITSCTNRKRAQAGKPISLTKARFGSLDEVAQAWRLQVDKANAIKPATEVYAGRAFSESLATQGVLDADLYVVSAGLGLVSGNARIPAYNMTVADSSSRLGTLIAKFGKSPANWWALLNQEPTPIAELVASEPATFLIALPASYLPMVSEDLEKIPRTKLQKIRIFTSPAGRNLLSRQLKTCVLPYDERLEGSVYSGTRTDFAQRAMAHFVSQLNAHTLTLKAARKSVSSSMEFLKKPHAPTRRKAADEELMEIISKNWHAHAGSSSKLLRYLRDEALVSCEQSRFRSLHAAVRERI